MQKKISKTEDMYCLHANVEKYEYTFYNTVRAKIKI